MVVLGNDGSSVVDSLELAGEQSPRIGPFPDLHVKVVALNDSGSDVDASALAAEEPPRHDGALESYNDALTLPLKCNWLEDYSEQRLMEMQDADPTVSRLAKWVREGIDPSEAEVMLHQSFFSQLGTSSVASFAFLVSGKPLRWPRDV